MLQVKAWILLVLVDLVLIASWFQTLVFAILTACLFCGNLNKPAAAGADRTFKVGVGRVLGDLKLRTWSCFQFMGSLPGLCYPDVLCIWLFQRIVWKYLLPRPNSLVLSPSPGLRSAVAELPQHQSPRSPFCQRELRSCFIFGATGLFYEWGSG